jgi:hypothetical protein
MGGEVIYGNFGWLSISQLLDMLDEQLVFQRVGMVKVDFDTLGWGQAAQILIIRIMLEEGYPVRADTLEDGLGNRGLAGSGATGDADDEWG